MNNGRYYSAVINRALDLLLDNLSPAQLNEWRSYQTITVIGKRRLGILWHSRYRISIATDYVKVRHWCVSVNDWNTLYPPHDQVLAIKLWIEGNEKEFRKTANAWWMFWRYPRELLNASAEAF